MTHSFTLVIDVDDLTDEVANRLCEAGCDDATVSRSGGETKLAFDREEISFAVAMLSAIRNVNQAGYRVVRIINEA
jgi:hypothetical protein